MKEVMKLGTMSDREKLVERIYKQLEGATEQELRIIYLFINSYLQK